jgi:hypothetical protein
MEKRREARKAAEQVGRAHGLKPGHLTTFKSLAVEVVDAIAPAIAAAATESERTRVRTILQSTEAKGREAMAQRLAFENDMPADDAVALLGAAPKQAGGFTPLSQAMKSWSPGIDPDDGSPDNPDDPDAIAQAIINAEGSE